MPKVRTKRKVSVNGSKKGGRWERVASVSLSMWVSKKAETCRDDLIWRAAGSGSRATVANKRNKDRSGQAGDLVSNGVEASGLFERFFIECKSYANFGFQNLLWRSSANPLNICIDEPIAKAAQHGKWPMLLLKQNQKTPVMVVPASIGTIIARGWHIFPDATFIRDIDNGRTIKHEYFNVFDFSEFLATVDYNEFISQVPLRDSHG